MQLLPTIKFTGANEATAASINRTRLPLSDQKSKPFVFVLDQELAEQGVLRTDEKQPEDAVEFGLALPDEVAPTKPVDTTPKTNYRKCRAISAKYVTDVARWASRIHDQN